MNYEEMAVSVSDLNKYIKEKVDQDEYLNNVLVKGEISNFKHHYTGHMYFTLKDDKSLIKCIMFKTYTASLNFMPKDGMQVIVLGTISVFERDGVYQIYCKAMQSNGVGDLHREYEELKKKLEQEGLFDEEHKKRIPMFPKTIGVLTSQTGSVIRDIINVSTRRNPNVHIKLFPVPVQGEGAGDKIADAIYLMNQENLADVLIVARGGGSLEDLWPFNEEVVARAIYYSKIPIISAVGHETDFSISDFVSDLRAPTPSAAAELAVPDVQELKIKLDNYEKRFRISLKRKIEFMKLRYEKVMKSKAFSDPLVKINENFIKIDQYVKMLQDSINKKITNSKNLAINLINKLDAMSPLKTLTRGYCISEKNGSIVKSSKSLTKDDEITLIYEDGKKNARII